MSEHMKDGGKDPASGKFTKGNKLAKAGKGKRPKDAKAHARELARKAAAKLVPKAIKTLDASMSGKDGRTARQAATDILDLAGIGRTSSAPPEPVNPDYIAAGGHPGTHRGVATYPRGTSPDGIMAMLRKLAGDGAPAPAVWLPETVPIEVGNLQAEVASLRLRLSAYEPVPAHSPYQARATPPAPAEAPSETWQDPPPAPLPRNVTHAPFNERQALRLLRDKFR